MFFCSVLPPVGNTKAFHDESRYSHSDVHLFFDSSIIVDIAVQYCPS
jgi:hypothetical protein